MGEPYMTQVTIFGCTYAPKNWRWCDGSLLPIAEHNAIYALVGTTYGGDGRLTFGIPNLIGRVPIGTGSAPGITTRYPGMMGGVENVTLSIHTMPSHTHSANAHATSAGVLQGEPNTNATVRCNNTASSTIEPAGKVWGKSSGRDNIYADDVSGTDAMHPGLVNVTVDMSTVSVNVATSVDSVIVGSTGDDNAHYNMQPFQVIPYSFSLSGIFPSRN